MTPGTDSAGVPWQGREFHAHTYGADDGTAPAAFLEAMALFRRGEAGADAVVDSLRDARLLVPLVAELGDSGTDAHGRTVDKSQELSIVSVRAPDGRTALPVFSSVAAMQAWNPQARPVPSEAARVAAAALGEGAALVIVDATSETEFVIRPAALYAMASGASWTPPHADAGVRASIERAAAAEPAVGAIALVDGDPESRLAGLDVVLALGLRPGLDAAGVQAGVERMQSAWLADGVVTERVDSLAVRIEPLP